MKICDCGSTDFPQRTSPGSLKCRACRNERRREANAEYRRRVIEHYGARCECCGEKTMAFLSIDHKDGGGNEHRRSLNGSLDTGGSATLYRWLVRAGFPEGYRVLCFNCNLGRAINGKCPHEEMQ